MKEALESLVDPLLGLDPSEAGICLHTLEPCEGAFVLPAAGVSVVSVASYFPPAQSLSGLIHLSRTFLNNS